MNRDMQGIIAGKEYGDVLADAVPITGAPKISVI